MIAGKNQCASTGKVAPIIQRNRQKQVQNQSPSSEKARFKKASVSASGYGISFLSENQGSKNGRENSQENLEASGKTNTGSVNVGKTSESSVKSSMLPTSKTKLCNSSDPAKVKIANAQMFFDCGSQRSFISHSMAQKLGLDSHGHDRLHKPQPWSELYKIVCPRKVQPLPSTQSAVCFKEREELKGQVLQAPSMVVSQW